MCVTVDPTIEGRERVLVHLCPPLFDVYHTIGVAHSIVTSRCAGVVDGNTPHQQIKKSIENDRYTLWPVGLQFIDSLDLNNKQSEHYVFFCSNGRFGCCASSIISSITFGCERRFRDRLSLLYSFDFCITYFFFSLTIACISFCSPQQDL